MYINYSRLQETQTKITNICTHITSIHNDSIYKDNVTLVLTTVLLFSKPITFYCFFCCGSVTYFKQISSTLLLGGYDLLSTTLDFAYIPKID